MSVRLMAEVFARYPRGGSEMLLALALADHAHDDGTCVRPSVGLLAEKTRQSERAVQYQLRNMEAAGWLQLVGSAAGGRNTPREYRINPDWLDGADLAPDAEKGAKQRKKGCNLAQKGCKTAQERVQSGAERVQNSARKGATAIAPEPRATINKSNQEQELLFADREQPAAPDSGRSVVDDAEAEETAAPRVLGIRELLAEGVDRQHALDWLQVRKGKRAPLTPTAWASVKAQCVKACVTPAEAVRIAAENGWQGFRATWYARLKLEHASGPHGAQPDGFGQRDYGSGGAL